MITPNINSFLLCHSCNQSLKECTSIYSLSYQIKEENGISFKRAYINDSKTTPVQVFFCTECWNMIAGKNYCFDLNNIITQDDIPL